MELEGTKLISHFRIESNGSGDNSGNGSGETGSEFVSGDIQTGIEPEISQDSDLVDSQKIDVSAQIEPGIVQAVSSFREVTVEEIRKEISEFVFLTKNEIRIIVALISAREKELKRGELGITNVADSNIPKALTRLEDLGLICYENNRELIKPNLERIAASYPWIYSKEIQEIVRTKPDFRLGRSVQKVLGLLHKFTDGLARNEIIDGIGLTRGGFVRSETTMKGYDLIKVTDRNGEAIIISNFSVGQIEEGPATSEETTVTKTDLTQEKEQAGHDDSAGSADNNNQRTESGFVSREIKSVARRIKSLPNGSDSLSLQHLSSQFGAGKKGGLTELLNEINKITPIEILDVSSNKIITSWKPKDFKGIDFKDLRVRRFSGEQTNDHKDQKGPLDADAKGGKQESYKGGQKRKQEAVNDDSNPDELSMKRITFKKAIREVKPEDIKRRIEEMINYPNLGTNQKTILSILFKNHLDNNFSLEMKVSDLMKIAQEKKLGSEQVKVCFPSLQVLGFIEKPNENIKLKINI